MKSLVARNPSVPTTSHPTTLHPTTLHFKALSTVFLTRAALTLVIGLALHTSIASAQVQRGDIMSQASLREQAFLAISKGNYVTAIQAGDALLRQYPKQPSAARLAGDIFLRAGKVKDAVRQFDRYLEMTPSAAPDLWQRGIALYFAGEYEKAAQQFVIHRTVNENDVENATWHFLCVAKLKSFEDAEQSLLPAPGDPRVPMEAVYKLFEGNDPELVTQAIEALPEDSSERTQAAFYGDLYRGMYADAKGERTRAFRYMERAVARAPETYMGDVARLYAAALDR